MLQEINFDGIVGPSHNYAGLSLGNIASASHKGDASHPRAAALQGIAKMRAGPPLARNLRHVALGQAPRQWRPQKRHLALISTGGKHAVASRGWLYAQGDWVWTLKEWNDRRWMRKYKDL